MSSSFWNGLSPRSFELQVASLFEHHGFDAEVKGAVGDGGIDIIIGLDGMRGIVQCKRYEHAIGPHAVRDLYGTYHGQRESPGGADLRMAVLICTGGFTPGAKAFASGRPIALMDAKDLAMLAIRRVDDRIWFHLEQVYLVRQEIGVDWWGTGR